ncbi:hypothetical protein HNI00_07995 [Thermoleptolyngbya oregonensis NK1-22]|uniref:Uncharacterized protein n=1 Tax=Thermoleptolyngbya oregonensis NK1-22 TaxID=2547457 RepID=A0AA97BCK1_9CYAN|nr:hypothetical protein [Thermoleptolyngbya oregonensis]WOB43104.1 hypothetical protein HNI00_07995 [Thermoleptolyngbya oregonensis NK1-22]
MQEHKLKAYKAYKVKGRIDATGHLIITEPIELEPGDVEVILLQAPVNLPVNLKEQSESDLQGNAKKGSLIQAFQGLFENAPSVPTDFDLDQAKWEYLKEKHNL